MARPRLLFLATEDWFFANHFPMLPARAIDEGFDVVIAARMSGALREASGVRLVDTKLTRGARGLSMAREIVAMRLLLQRERPDLLHVFGLKPITLALTSGAAAPSCVLAVIGRGYLGAARVGMRARAIDGAVRRLVRARLERPGGVLAVENGHDRAWVERGRRLPEDRVVLMPGAGVDIDAMTPAPEPEGLPIVVGVAARLVRSKGVDVAVAAVQRLRAQGCDVVLRIAGAPDPENPDPVSSEELAAWREAAGIEVLGQVRNIAAFWASTHIACVPSRGGEGLPRTLLEAAACGRPIVTTDTPGCADFMRPGEIGVVVAPGDADALARALKPLCEDARMRSRFGQAARRRVSDAFTSAHAATAAARAWRMACARVAQRV